MPKVREPAVSRLMQGALPQSNIFFIIEGSADVQTLIAKGPLAISFFIIPEMRQRVRETQDPCLLYV